MAKSVLIALVVTLLGFSIGVSAAEAGNRLFVAAGDGGDTSGPYGGAATDAGLFGGVRDIAVSPDGGFLIPVTDDGSVILRVDPKGWVRRVAGSATRTGFGGDGGPATKAQLDSPSDITVTADGGFLIVDNCRVRRVAPDGIITTVAGSGSADDCPYSDAPGPAPGDGGPATAAQLRQPYGVAELTNGGFFVTEGNRVRRVGPDGRITTVAGTGAAGKGPPRYGEPASSVELLGPDLVAGLPDGGFLVRDGYGIHRVRPDGIIVAGAGTNTVFSDDGTLYRVRLDPVRLWGPLPSQSRLIAGGRPGYFGGWGDPALSASLSGFGAVEPVPGGGLLFISEDERSSSPRVIFSAPSGDSRLGIAITRETLPALLHRRLRFRLTRAARVKIRLYRGRRLAVRRTVLGKPGLNTVRLPRRTERGLHYARVRATSSDGAVATNGIRVLVGAGLPRKVAEAEISAEFVCEGECGGVQDSAEPCRRFGPRRVDCVIGSEDLDTGATTPCSSVVSAVLRRSGYLYLRPYGCRKRKRVGYFRGRPRYTAKAREAPPL